MIYVYDLICILSDVGCFDQDKTIKAENSCWTGGTCQKIERQVGGSVDVSKKASSRGFKHWAKKSGYYAKDIGVAESIDRLGNRLQERTMRRRIGRSVEGPMICRTT